MTRFVPPVLLAVASGTSDVGVRLIENHPVGLANAVAIAAAVGAACLWLEHRLAKIETHFDDLPCQKKNGGIKACPKHKRKR